MSSHNTLYVQRISDGRVAKMPSKLYEWTQKAPRWNRYVGPYRFANDYDDTPDGKYLIKMLPYVTPKCMDILEGNIFVEISDEWELTECPADIRITTTDIFSGRIISVERHKRENKIWRLKKN